LRQQAQIDLFHYFQNKKNTITLRDVFLFCLLVWGWHAIWHFSTHLVSFRMPATFPYITAQHTLDMRVCQQMRRGVPLARLGEQVPEKALSTGSG
jgi:hypothetical protein